MDAGRDPARTPARLTKPCAFARCHGTMARVVVERPALPVEHWQCDTHELHRMALYGRGDES